MKRRCTMMLALVLVAGMVVGGTAAAHAEEEPELSRGIFGTVANISIDGEGTGTINLEGAEPVAIDAATRYHVPTFVPPWQVWTDLSDDARIFIKGAVRVSILLTEDVAERTAMKVMVVTQQPVRSHHVGVVVSVDGDTLTLLKHNGHEITITLPEGMDLAPGDVVTIVGHRLAGETRSRAVAAHNIKQLANRLQAHLDGARGEAAFEQVSDLLDRAHSRHLEMLERLQERIETQANVRAVEALGKAIQNARGAYDDLMQRRTEIRDRVRDSWDEWEAHWVEMAGTIVHVDIDGGTVIIAPADGEEVTLVVSESTRILIGSSLSELDGLAPGDVVSKAVYSGEPPEVALIVIEAPVVIVDWRMISGVVSDIDLDEQTVTVTRAIGDPVTVTITGETRIAMGGRIITLDQIEAGWLVKQAIYAAETMEAQSLWVMSPPSRGRP